MLYMVLSIEKATEHIISFFLFAETFIHEILLPLCADNTFTQYFRMSTAAKTIDPKAKINCL